MSLNSFDRNYGASKTSREFWGGNNGFITVAVAVDDAGALVFPTMADYVAADASTDVGANLIQNAERNLKVITQTLAQRGVIVTTSVPTVHTTTAQFATLGALKTAGEAKPTVLHSASAGTLTAAPTANAIFQVTFVVERADVFTDQAVKPGAVNPAVYAVDPLQEIVDALGYASIFEAKTSERNPDGSGATFVQAKGVVAYVLDALPAV